MRRFLSVWLPRWPIERRHWRATPHGGAPRHKDAPLVQVAEAQHGLRITATTPAADRLGLRIGMPLADGRAICPSVAVETADPEGDAAALRRLARWCRCYSPWTAVQAPDGIGIEITGCAHLFGGEATLLAELERRLQGFGLTAKLAIAPTIGAAWAATRHATDTCTIVTDESLRRFLSPLPVSSLRLDEMIISGLAVVGLKQVGDLLDKPRAPLTSRFGSQLIRRLDQALGDEAETFQPLAPPALYRVERRFAEPIVLLIAIERTVGALAHDLADRLINAGKGARRIELDLFRVDGRLETLAVQTSTLCREADHMARLFRERLDRVGDDIDAGFGFEVVTLGAFDVERFAPRQETLRPDQEQGASPGDLARLLDRFVNRFGPRNVVRFAPRASHIPERVVRSVSGLQEKENHDWAAHIRVLQGGAHLGRPLLLLSPPEPITALSEVPDGPPIRFEWNRISHRVTRAEGPERIAPEWWLYRGGRGRQTRDYYRVEDDEGRRFWLYRDGLYDREGDPPRWFIHGVFG